jgi:hypothetical protein
MEYFRLESRTIHAGYTPPVRYNRQHSLTYQYTLATAAPSCRIAHSSPLRSMSRRQSCGVFHLHHLQSIRPIVRYHSRHLHQTSRLALSSYLTTSASFVALTQGNKRRTSPSSSLLIPISSHPTMFRRSASSDKKDDTAHTHEHSHARTSAVDTPAASSPKASTSQPHSHSHSHDSHDGHDHSHGLFHTHIHDHSEGAAQIMNAITTGKMDKGTRITLIGELSLLSPITA